MVAQEILLSTKPFGGLPWSVREAYEPPLACLQHGPDE